jgi:2-hydroxy-6-oxonona-2,4-dienedioate hydrolase
MLRRRWTVVGDAVIHSRETTDASALGARPLLLLHGVGATSRYFGPLLRALDGRAPAVAVELPGVGSSSSPHRPQDIAEQADLVARWLRATGRCPAAVVGNSMGAQTAVELAVRHPDLAERLVLIGPTVDAEARRPLRQIGRLLVDATVERPQLIALTLTDSFLTDRTTVLRYFQAMLAHRIEERIPLVSVPVLVVRGELDPVVPRRWARRLVALAPLGTSVEVPGGGHACHYGRPGLVAGLLLATIDAPEPAV